jgi:hypothetical protein
MDRQQSIKKWLEAVKDLGENLDQKGFGDLMLEMFLLGSHLPGLSKEILEQAEFHKKLEAVRFELNKREQQVAITLKILRDKGLV